MNLKGQRSKRVNGSNWQIDVGENNETRENIVEFSEAYNLSIVNMFF